MNRSYNHINHLVDRNDIIITFKSPLHWQDVKHEENQLDDKQRHTRFDYYEYNVSKLGTPCWAQSSLDRSHVSLNFQEHSEDFENEQARH